ncbi:MAG: hypothetical protein J2O48_04580 [Solirubrobacterales bacterium]|nr:hypothetical protein [Solirubrobacterales bacterium]
MKRANSSAMVVLLSDDARGAAPANTNAGPVRRYRIARLPLSSRPATVAKPALGRD